MQKNKSFQKTTKVSKQISNCSSRALLQLSQITAYSKDKSAFMQNFSERSGYPSIVDLEGAQGQPTCKIKTKQKAKSNSKKQTYLRQKAPLPNNVLNQIMQISNSLPIRNHNLESSKLMQKDSDLIILSKSDLQKNKNFSQTKKNKKLLLYENKQNHQKTMSKSKSSISQIIKGEPILCSIKIHPLEDQKSSHNVSSIQKRQSFDGRRSSFSSRRSSIHLFPQDDFASELKMNDIKNSFLAKISLADQNVKKPEETHGRVDSFLKKSSLNYYEQNSYSEELKANELKQTRENQTQITPREKKQVREKYLLKLDELNVIEEDIRKDASKFLPLWDHEMEAEKNLKKYRKNFQEVKQNYEKILSQSSMLKNLLFQENKRYVLGKRMSNNNFNSQKQNILLEVEKIHTEVKKKVFKKDLEDTMVFNMKVVLPSSSQLMESSMSCLDNHISMSLNYSNITVLQLYEELMNQKASKKYGMILKKEINNMNIYDNRTMNEYLKKLYELETMFNKIQGEDPQNDTEYLQRIEDIVEKIDETDQQLARVQRQHKEVENKIQVNEKVKNQSVLELENLLNSISESVFTEYKIFQTGGKSDQDSKTSPDSLINESYSESDKPISQFTQLVEKKYEGLYNRYKQVKEEKRMIMDSLKGYQ